MDRDDILQEISDFKLSRKHDPCSYPHLSNTAVVQHQSSPADLLTNTYIFNNRFNILDLVHHPDVWTSEHLKLTQIFPVYEWDAHFQYIYSVWRCPLPLPAWVVWDVSAVHGSVL